MPWNKPDDILKRYQLSGTQIVIAGNVGLDAALWKGVPVLSSSDVLPELVKRDPRTALAITSSDVADVFVNRTEKLKVLAYQHAGQFMGFLPDTDRGSWDKRNVRDGHYMLWEPLRMYARADAKPHVIDVINVLRNATPLETLSYVGVLKYGGLVPRCAMRVDRDKAGNLVPFRPESSCQCAFELAAPSSGMMCTACSAGSPCPTGTACSYGYCEPL